MGELCGFACPIFARLMKRCFYFILLNFTKNRKDKK